MNSSLVTTRSWRISEEIRSSISFSVLERRSSSTLAGILLNSGDEERKRAVTFCWLSWNHASKRTRQGGIDGSFYLV